MNYFQPSFKLKEKHREGARVKKVYYPPATPCDRLLGDPRVTDRAKHALRKTRDQLDPVVLLHRIRKAQADLLDTPNASTPQDLEVFLKQLPILWKDGEVSPAHRKPTMPLCANNE